MGVFDFDQEDELSVDVNNGKENKDKTDDESKAKLGAGIAVDASVQQSIVHAKVKFTRPDYNPQTRKAFYDDGQAHKRAIENAFSSGETVRDPYTGAELMAKQKDAKLKYGKNWQKHAAEADHIDPLSRIVKRNENNKWVTTEDIKDIANQDDNYQVMSRSANQNSKSMGKGGSTQSEWAKDGKRMEGMAKHAENGKSKKEIQQEVEKTGLAAEKRNDIRLKKAAVKNVVTTGHEAGIAGAQNAGITTLTMSGIMNMVSVIKGEKECNEAIEDIAKDSGKAAVTGYVMGGGLTVLTQTLPNVTPKLVTALAESNVPGKVITAITVTGDTLKKWGNGEITTQECIIQLGDKGLNMATMGYSMVVGQTLIPIPIVGGAIGAMVGSMLTSSYYHKLVDSLKRKELEHQERKRVIAECEAAKEQIKAFRIELEKYLEKYLQEFRAYFDEILSSLELSYELGDADGVIAGANDIIRKLDGNVQYNTMEEFKSFLDSDDVDEF